MSIPNKSLPLFNVTVSVLCTFPSLYALTFDFENVTEKFGTDLFFIYSIKFLIVFGDELSP